MGKVVEAVRQLLICLGRFLGSFSGFLLRFSSFLGGCGILELGAFVFLGFGSGLFLGFGFLLQGFLLFKIGFVLITVHLVEDCASDNGDGNQRRCRRVIVNEPLVGLRSFGNDV